MDIKWNPSARELRQFAAIWFPAFCGMIGWFALRGTGSLNVAIGIWAGGALIGAIGYWVPRIIRPVFVGLSLATYPIGWAVSHLLLAVVFYGLITPIGLALRLAGRDALGRRFDRPARTYWVPRASTPTPSQYFRQF